MPKHIKSIASVHLLPFPRRRESKAVAQTTIFLLIILITILHCEIAFAEDAAKYYDIPTVQDEVKESRSQKQEPSEEASKDEKLKNENLTENIAVKIRNEFGESLMLKIVLIVENGITELKEKQIYIDAYQTLGPMTFTHGKYNFHVFNLNNDHLGFMTKEIVQGEGKMFTISINQFELVTNRNK